jgi:hypothetical protein
MKIPYFLVLGNRTNRSVKYIFSIIHMINPEMKMTSPETMYLLEHSSEIEDRYAGRYIAIHGDKIVAAGRTIHELYELTDKIGIKDPLVTYVPRDGEELLLV